MHRFFSKPETLLRLRRGPWGDVIPECRDRIPTLSSASLAALGRAE